MLALSIWMVNNGGFWLLGMGVWRQARGGS